MLMFFGVFQYGADGNVTGGFDMNSNRL
jgi:hypothetical protein